MRIMCLFHGFISMTLLCAWWAVRVCMYLSHPDCLIAHMGQLPWLSTVHSEIFTGQRGYRAPLAKTCKTSTSMFHCTTRCQLMESSCLAAGKAGSEPLDLEQIIVFYFASLRRRQSGLRNLPFRYLCGGLRKAIGIVFFKMAVWSCLLFIKIIDFKWSHRHHEVKWNIPSCINPPS